MAKKRTGARGGQIYCAGFWGGGGRGNSHGGNPRGQVWGLVREAHGAGAGQISRAGFWGRRGKSHGRNLGRFRPGV